ncbi:glycosyltransferase [Rickettsia bellii]|uniref:Glycosyl transferase 2 family protein n=1 Tax=Rickettsia bellii str. RML An4 TaxID=1359193 RepID=A0A0F3QAN3_RICBE|nr:glycosyltransferase [Rickettsia bellii]ARD86691.1 glycosyltransferase [Rickettsia bellii]KJV89630.1 glycosyl transferase 2 family protein [Rickettsia bellii str. RML An4]
MIIKQDKLSTFYPLVSIIIPVYNGAIYMREAIDSALAQTYKNIEVIVVNDGSKDSGETEAIALSYGDKIRYFHKENGGCGSALNYGIKNMKGKYFSWLSHDDLYYPNKVEHQINILNKLNNKNTIIYGGYELVDKNGKFLYHIRPDSVLTTDKLNISLLPLLRGLINGCSLLIPVKYFHEVDMFDETLPSTQDYDLWFKIFRVASIYFDKLILIKSRFHSEQGSKKISAHNEECNALWSSFLQKLTEEEMIKMEGSAYLFLTRTANFLSSTPYQEAYALANNMAKQILRDAKVSVIIPVYNRINWTIQSIESVLNQTHENFEVIVINDGSTEDISELIKFCKKDKRIQYFHKKNEGPASARNLGIKKSSGKYIAFLDSDDLFFHNKLELQLKFMEENNFIFSHTSYQRIDEEGKYLESINSGSFSGNVFPKIIQTCPIAMPTVMGTLALFQENLFPENIRSGEDCCLWISISSRNLLGGVSKELSKVRIRGDNTTFMNPNKYSQGLINITSYVLNNAYLAKFAPFTINLLLTAVTQLKILESKNESESLENEDESELLENEDKSELLENEDKSESLENEDKSESLENEDKSESLENEDKSESLENEKKEKNVEKNNNYFTQYNYPIIKQKVRKYYVKKLLENKKKEENNYFISYLKIKLKSYYFIAKILILLTIASLKEDGVRATISKIKRWFKKHRRF